MNLEIVTAVAIGIGLAASAGFRVFVPMLVASVAAHLGVLPLQDGFGWLGSTPAMICFGTATVVEIAAYYIPVVDNFLDSITTPLAVGAGALLMTSVLPIEGGLLQWVTGFIVGGGIAGVVQGGSMLTRLLSTGVSGGTANPAVATGENAAAVGTSILTLFIPLMVASAVLILIIAGFALLRRRLFRRRHPGVT